jgi:hypothetical protein
MNAGRVVGELPAAQCDEATLGRLMGGAATAAPTDPTGQRQPGVPAGAALPA